MAKPDVRRDYYADLGLAPSAEGEDIKKQFRKLALKYHPDKNPGKEAEFNAKFQAIKTAHDLLSDPQQRLKYDTDRLRAGYGRASGPPRATTARRAQPQPSSFRPPPRPQYNPPPFTKPQPASNGPSAGAKRYEAHARAGPQSWQKSQDESQTRADAFKGFSGMRGSAAGAAGWRGFDPNTGRSTPGGTPRQQNQPFGKARPQSAYERFQESYRTQNPSSSPHSPKKRNGYAPGASGDDEPMARNTSAYTSSSRPSSMYFDPPPPPPTAKKPAAPDPYAFTPEFERTSSRYATAGGEKTFFTSSRLRNPSNLRTPSRDYETSSSRPNPSSSTSAQHERHRSASPKAGRNRAFSSEATSSDLDDQTSSEEDLPEPDLKPKPKAIPKSRLRGRQKFHDIYGGNNSSSSTGENPRAREDHGHFGTTPAPRVIGNYRRRSGYQDHHFADIYPDKGHNSDSAAFPKSQQDPLGGFSSRPDSAQSKPTSQPIFGRDSPSNLHKKFSEEDWREHISKFDFLGAHATNKNSFRSSPRGDKATPPESLRNMFASPDSQNARRTANSTGSGESTAAGSPGLGSFAPTGGNGTAPQAQPQQKPTPFAQAKFSAEQWSEQLQNMSWNVADASNTRQTNTPPSRSPKRPTTRSGNKVRSGPQPAKVATEAEESRETINDDTAAPESTGTPLAGADVEPEAMDLDDEVPPVHPTASAVPGHESSSGSANTSYPDINGNTASNVSASSKEVPPPNTMNGASKPEARAPLFNLDNLRNTVPFTSTNSGGIENLEDVFATLPFESKARQQTTTKQDIRPRELKLPNPPKRPRAPELVLVQPGSSQHILPRDKWKHYVSSMGSYMHEWNAFNRRMLLHFNTRQDAIETGLAPGWMSAVGDTARLRMNGDEGDATLDKSELHADSDIADSDELVPDRRTGGYSAYLRGIEEDFQVRKHWDVACEMHRDCILELGRLREWIRNGGKVV